MGLMESIEKDPIIAFYLKMSKSTEVQGRLPLYSETILRLAFKQILNKFRLLETWEIHLYCKLLQLYYFERYDNIEDILMIFPKHNADSVVDCIDNAAGILRDWHTFTKNNLHIVAYKEAYLEILSEWCLRYICIFRQVDQDALAWKTCELQSFLKSDIKFQKTWLRTLQNIIKTKAARKGQVKEVTEENLKISNIYRDIKNRLHPWVVENCARRRERPTQKKPFIVAPEHYNEAEPNEEAESVTTETPETPETPATNCNRKRQVKKRKKLMSVERDDDCEATDVEMTCVVVEEENGDAKELFIPLNKKRKFNKTDPLRMNATETPSIECWEEEYQLPSYHNPMDGDDNANVCEAPQVILNGEHASNVGGQQLETGTSTSASRCSSPCGTETSSSCEYIMVTTQQIHEEERLTDEDDTKYELHGAASEVDDDQELVIEVEDDLLSNLREQEEQEEQFETQSDNETGVLKDIWKSESEGTLVDIEEDGDKSEDDADTLNDSDHDESVVVLEVLMKDEDNHFDVEIRKEKVQQEQEVKYSVIHGEVYVTNILPGSSDNDENPIACNIRSKDFDDDDDDDDNNDNKESNDNYGEVHDDGDDNQKKVMDLYECVEYLLEDESSEEEISGEYPEFDYGPIDYADSPIEESLVDTVHMAKPPTAVSHFKEYRIEESPIEEMPFEELPFEELPFEELSNEESSIEESRIEESPIEKPPIEESPIEEPPIEEFPLEEPPIEEFPLEELSNEESPIEALPFEELSNDETPIEESPMEDSLIEESPIEESHIKESPIDESPIEESSFEESSIEESPMDESLIEESPTEESPMDDLLIEESPVEEAHIEEFPIEESTVEGAPIEQSPMEDAIGEIFTLADLQILETTMEESSPNEESAMEESSLIAESAMEESSPIEDSAMEESSLIAELAMEESSLIAESAMEESSPIEESAMEESSLIAESAMEESSLIAELAMEESSLIAESDMEESSPIELSAMEGSSPITESPIEHLANVEDPFLEKAIALEDAYEEVVEEESMENGEMEVMTENEVIRYEDKEDKIVREISLNVDYSEMIEEFLPEEQDEYHDSTAGERFTEAQYVDHYDHQYVLMPAYPRQRIVCEPVNALNMDYDQSELGSGLQVELDLLQVRIDEATQLIEGHTHDSNDSDAHQAEMRLMEEVRAEVKGVVAANDSDNPKNSTGCGQPVAGHSNESRPNEPATVAEEHVDTDSSDSAQPVEVHIGDQAKVTSSPLFKECNDSNDSGVQQVQVHIVKETGAADDKPPRGDDSNDSGGTSVAVTPNPTVAHEQPTAQDSAAGDRLAATKESDVQMPNEEKQRLSKYPMPDCGVRPTDIDIFHGGQFNVARNDQSLDFLVSNSIQLSNTEMPRYGAKDGANHTDAEKLPTDETKTNEWSRFNNRPCTTTTTSGMPFGIDTMSPMPQPQSQSQPQVSKPCETTLTVSTSTSTSASILPTIPYFPALDAPCNTVQQQQQQQPVTSSATGVASATMQQPQPVDLMPSVSFGQVSTPKLSGENFEAGVTLPPIDLNAVTSLSVGGFESSLPAADEIFDIITDNKAETYLFHLKSYAILNGYYDAIKHLDQIDQIFHGTY